MRTARRKCERGGRGRGKGLRREGEGGGGRTRGARWCMARGAGGRGGGGGGRHHATRHACHCRFGRMLGRRSSGEARLCGLAHLVAQLRPLRRRRRGRLLAVPALLGVPESSSGSALGRGQVSPVLVLAARDARWRGRRGRRGRGRRARRRRPRLSLPLLWRRLRRDRIQHELADRRGGLGDREQHAVGLRHAQLLYCGSERRVRTGPALAALWRRRPRLINRRQVGGLLRRGGERGRERLVRVRGIRPRLLLLRGHRRQLARRHSLAHPEARAAEEMAGLPGATTQQAPCDFSPSPLAAARQRGR